MKKRLLSWLMVLTLCLTLLPTAALAVDGEEQGPAEAGEETLIQGQPEEPEKEPAPEAEPALLAMSDISTYSEEEHTNHPICGAACSHTGSDSHGTTTFENWLASNWDANGLVLRAGGEDNTYGDELGKKAEDWDLPAGNYYLKDNITVEYAIVISGDVTICLNGKTITGQAPASGIHSSTTDPVFRVENGGKLTLTDCKGNTGKVTHTGGSTAYGIPAGVQVLKDGTFNMYGGKISGNREAGVYLNDKNAGTFNLYDGEISGNTRGVYVGRGGTFNMYGGTIKDHQNSRGVDCKSIFNMSGGTISGCGDGVYLRCDKNDSGYGYIYGTFTMTGGTITENSYGVALYAYFNMVNGVRKNPLGRSEFTMTGGEITGNTELGVDAGATASSSSREFAAGGTLIVGGTAKIQNNGTNRWGNVYLDEGEIKLATSQELAEGAYIGITLGSDRLKTLTAENQITIVEGKWGQSDVSGYFHSDDSEYKIQSGENNAVLLTVKPHEHYLCGTTHTDIGNHTEDSKTSFTAELKQVNDQLTKDGETWNTTPVTINESDVSCYVLPEGSYYLGSDLKLNAPIYVSEDVRLCLNGKSIESNDTNLGSIIVGTISSGAFTLIDCQNTGSIKHASGNSGSGVYMNGNSTTFNLYGGAITGNTDSGVCATQTNTFNMYGGSITRNSTNVGGGGGVNAYGTFNMYGGEITGNTATGNGGGVYVEGAQDSYLGGILTVSGAAKITGNTVNGTANNVYLPKANKNLIYVIGALTDGAEIGVTPENWPMDAGEVAIATGMDAATGKIRYRMTEDDKVCFKSDNSDNSDYEISLNKSSNVLVLTKKGSTPTEKQEQAELKLTADKTTLAVGETLTLTVTGGSGSGAVTCTVSDTEKATINGTTLTAKKAGTVTVTATKAGDETYNAIDSNTITITITEKSVDPTPSTPSSSGSSSSGPRIIKTETRTAPDGSVTKTETWSDGTVTETTTGKDGSTAKTTTRKDGSSVTESKDANGTTGTVKTDKNGKTEAEAKISNKAVEDAKKSGEAVKVPTEAKAGEDSNSAPTVKVELPKNAGETKIEIPVEDANSGTVAVIVHPDGTEEIVKDSVPTEDGVQLTVDGSTTIKIIDNSKDFIDTRDHWSRDEVNFVVARELFNGVGNDLFGVNQPMTRGMVNTVLARLAGVDTTPSAGQKWYEVGTAWAKANGITDGTNPEASVTREQLATLLYRFYGSPAVSGTLSFADAGAVSDYAQSALLWAVQNGILNGVGNNCVAPGADAQRAQVAAMMARYLKNAG